MSRPAQDADWSALDLVSAQAEAQLRHWRELERSAFAELMERAPTELQRELLRRSVASGHRFPEVKAFADALRHFSDAEAYAACTLSEAQAPYEPVSTRQWAEADPVYAFALNGHMVKPEGKDARSDREALRPAQAPRKSAPRVAAAVDPACRFGEDLFNEVCAPMGVAYREQAVDLGELDLARAVWLAADALRMGIPVPVLLGKEPGDFRRYALLLQLQASPGELALEMYDLASKRTFWIDAQALRSGAPIGALGPSPWRLTGIALPRRGEGA